MIQYAATHRLHRMTMEYRMPAFAGTTAVWCGKTLPLPLGAHEIEITAFVGLQDGLVEQMRVAALRPFRGRHGRQCRTALFKLGRVDQKVDASFCDVEPDHV